MPYLDWEVRLHYKSMASVINAANLQARLADGGTKLKTSPPGQSVQEMLIMKHLGRADPPLHIRRSLDQSFYSTASNTSERDTDQVVSRYSWEHGQTDINHSPMLMVDQCWMWILNNCELNTKFW